MQVSSDSRTQFRQYRASHLNKQYPVHAACQRSQTWLPKQFIYRRYLPQQFGLVRREGLLGAGFHHFISTQRHSRYQRPGWLATSMPMARSSPSGNAGCTMRTAPKAFG